MNLRNLLPRTNQSQSNEQDKASSANKPEARKGWRNPVKSVGMKLFFTFFISIVCFVLLVGFISYTIAKKTITDKAEAISQQTIIQTSLRLDLMFDKYAQIANQFIADKKFMELVSGVITDKDAYEKLTDSRQLQEQFTKFTLTENSIDGIHLLFSDGSPGISSQGSLEANVTKEQWYQDIAEADGKLVWMLPTQKKEGLSQGEGDTFAVARLMKDQNTFKDIGVLVIAVKASAINDELANVKLSENSSVHIAGTDGVVGFSTNHELINQKLHKGLDLTRMIGAVKDSKELIAQSKSQVTGWSLIGATPLKDLTKDTQKIFVVTLILALVAAGLAVLIGLLIIRFVATPLVQLSNLMQEGARGNLRVRTAVKSDDEIGQLSRSFNGMMEQITLLVQQTNISAQEVLTTSSLLNDASKNTATSAKEISVATEEIANGASTLAVDAERGNDLTQHISSRMGLVIQANERMGISAAEVQTVSEQGITYMSELIMKTNSTEEMTRTMVEKVDKLKESTSSIRKILEMLNNITKQTNILSLNATIEAARAGAAGKGFMVVADEIRKLADQSRQSIDVVGQITESIQTEIDETVQVLSEAYPLFQEQIVSVKEADRIFKDVHSNMGNFIYQLDDVSGSIQKLEESQQVLSEAMSSVSAVSQQSSATSEEVASLSQEQLRVSEGLVQLATKLDDLSKSLKESLTKFVI